MQIVRPTMEHLASYVAALERGWSPDNTRPEAGREELEQIHADAVGFIAGQEDRDAIGPAIKLSDGSFVNRLPGFHRWMWDGEFCGTIGFRWQKGTNELPPHCLGHIGYSVVPWKRRLGYATAALRQVLPEAKSVGLKYVEITTDLENEASQRVILANGGVLVEHFRKPPQYGGKPSLRFRIELA
ncbi:MAG: GNAT family N-acetyltransferase [Burkholderiales bacterium]|jgi:predicted acetyltransferase|nr:GNAT family N-acetyltransferase [Nitrosomonadaceae bacterium]